MRDAGTSLLRALIELAGGKEDAACLAAQSTAWASVTFTGARHRFTLHLTGADAETRATRLQATIGEVEFTLAGHLVADIFVSDRRAKAAGCELEIEALTIEAA